jgi:hypothetical protein
MDEKRNPPPSAIEYAVMAFVVALFIAMILDRVCDSGALLQSSLVGTTLGAGIVIGIIRWINRPSHSRNGAGNWRKSAAVVLVFAVTVVGWVLVQICNKVLPFIVD